MKEKWTKLGKSLICLALLPPCWQAVAAVATAALAVRNRQVAALQVRLQQGTITSMKRACLIVKEPVELTFLYVKGANTMDFKDQRHVPADGKGHQRQDQLAVRRRCGLG